MLFLALTAALPGIAPAPCAAQQDTAASRARPLRIIVATSAGGGVDITARHVAKALGERMRTTVLVEDRPGAGSTTGTEYAARATPDGHTLLILMFDNLTAARAPIDAGRVKALAVSPAQRAPQLPQVPTVNESGVTQFEGESWMGLFAPAATPRAAVDALRARIAEVLLEGELRARLQAGGGRLMNIAPAQQQAFLRSETERWRALIQRHRVTAD